MQPEPLLCVPGGAGDPAYLGDLGGLSAHRTLVFPERRPARPATPDDIETLRIRLGLDRIALLGHSAGANAAVRYAARHPRRVERLALVAPSTRAVGIDISAGTRLALARRRAAEPWFPAAFAALEAINAGTGADWEAVAPFRYGRWDAAARRHHAASVAAGAVPAADDADTPAATRAGLRALSAPVLLLAGEFDVNSPPSAVEECAGLVPDATFRVQPGAGHYPWLDDPARFVATLAGFLGPCRA
ncbi:alpha/beta fold hydrolase [Streptomyces sp. NPDC101160]|uniref:alpha/beta fold hydrolase n=1 Tax=Streptomyces sp. NPDC101160 TaxID=3366118 RepID=UPI00381EB213